MAKKENATNLEMWTAIIIVGAILVYFLSLYAVTLLKVEEQNYSFEYMGKNPGKYEIDQKIGTLTLSKTFVTTSSRGDLKCSFRTYPIQYVLPLGAVFFFIVNMTIYVVLLRKNCAKRENQSKNLT